MSSAVSASLALNITKFIQMAFMIGMCFFPSKMMEGYRADVFKGPGATIFQFAMGIMGIQMMHSFMITISSSKSYVAENEKSVACLCNAMIFFAFVLLDGRHVLLGTLPAAIPSAAILGNIVMFAAVVALNTLGWQSSGSVLPNFGAFLPKGAARMPLLAGMANLLFFAVGCGFLTETFLEMYLPGVLASVPGSANVAPMVYLVLGNAGKMMVFNILSMLSIASVGDVSTSDRMLRLSCFVNLFYMGSVSREHIIYNAMGWSSPMYALSFAQCFAVTFYQCNAFAAISATKGKTN